MLLVVGCASVGCVFSESVRKENDRQGPNSTWFSARVRYSLEESSAATLSIPAMEYQQRNQDWKRISGAGTAQFLECLAQALPALLALHSLLRMPRRSEFDTNNNGPSSLRVSFQPTLVVWEALNPGIWFVFCRAPRPPAVSVSCGHGSAE